MRSCLQAALLLPLVTLGCAGVRAPQTSAVAAAPVQVVCADAEQQLQRVWSAAARSAARQAVVAVPGVGGEASAELVVKELDASASRWRQAQQQNCTALPAEPRARLARAQIERCLGDALVAVGTLSEALQAPDAEMLSHVRDALAVVSDKTAACSRQPVYAFYGAAAAPGPGLEAARHDLARAEVLLKLERKQPGEAAFQRAHAAASDSGDVRLQVLTTVSEGTRLKGAHQYPQALKQAEQALQRASAAGYLVGQAEATVLSALIFRDQDNHHAEAQWFEKALPLYGAAFGEESLRTSAVLDHIGQAYVAREQFDVALEWFAKALALRQRLLGSDHPATLAVENHVAAAELSRGALPQAVQGYQAVLSHAAGNPLNAEALVDAYAGLADALSDQGKADQALAWLDKALSLQKILGPEREGLAIVINAIARVRQQKGEYDAALKGYLEALAIVERKFGKEHERVGRMATNIGALHDDRGNHREALRWHERALDIFLRVYGDNHSLTGGTYNNIGLTHLDLDEYAAAIEALERARWIKERTLGVQHPGTANTYNNLGLAYAGSGQYGRAIELYEKALVIREHVLGKEHGDTAGTYNNMGGAEKALNHPNEALAWYQKALAIKERVLGTSHPSTANTYNNIGAVQAELENYDAAIESYQKALAIKERALGRDHPSTAGSYHNLGAVEAMRGRYDEALKWYKLALAGRERSLGKEHAATRQTAAQIAEVERLKREAR